MAWTIETVKRDLPPVFVRIGKNVLPGRLSGRLKQFATVSVTNEGTLHSNSIIFKDYQVAWETVVNCLNNKRPVIGD